MEEEQSRPDLISRIAKFDVQTYQLCESMSGVPRVDSVNEVVLVSLLCRFKHLCCGDYPPFVVAAGMMYMAQ